jgi:hypothetical protein
MINLIKKIYRKAILELPENIDVYKASNQIRNFRKSNDNSYKDHSVVIFTKDRPLQLEALINSYFHYTKSDIKPHIIYNASTDKFKEAYNDLFQRFSDKLASVTDDSDGFKTALISTLESISTSHIYFLVDDIVFKNFFNPKDIFSFCDGYIPSLRMGEHLSFCYTQNKDQELPRFEKEGELLTWAYDDSRLDWGYPLSVDGHLFNLEEVKFMTSALQFKAPNTYEAKLQKFDPLFSKYKGICFKESIILNIPCNKVQTENDNLFGDLHQDQLLEIYSDKYINFKKYEGFKNVSCHQDVTLELQDRNNEA